MSEERRGPNIGDLLVGTFEILFGLCITLVGGGCTVMWLGVMFPSGQPTSGFTGGGFGLVMLLVSLTVAALGVFAIYHGIRIVRRRNRDR